MILSVCTYVYMYICIYVYMYICICEYDMHTRAVRGNSDNECMYICIYIYIYICIYEYVNMICTHAQFVGIRTRKHSAAP